MSTARISEKSGRHRAVSSGVALLSEIVDRKLIENLEQIATVVLAGALTGTPSKLNLILKIAERAGWTSEPEVVRSVASVATKLTDAAEWTEASTEEAGESCGGSREPEG